MARSSPNIIITGTPGVGKSTHCEQLAEATGLKHMSINQIVKDRNCAEGFDDELKSWIVDEDKLLDAIEDEVKDGGYIIDWHACDIFPESWIDLVVVLRCDTAVLYDRLSGRKYSPKKLEENMDAEIMQVLLDEAREGFAEEIVVELQSNTIEDVDTNVERIKTWVENWTRDTAPATS
ncbi:P-loop containing nucleoside triphosphate hydrolase protein [Eremomyces bilateralis CBS 781.70]|uniref:Adenylate kinase isoenzyme 6 homolog n=1 Tax=Eremomyces bilateralis CBS 781.70 TaxID=1392243 RepID=A0A6G1G5F6_9PEZI|nr:P-loop containing nucleoside triphosphate hydrolase protein [Eremomyces bilateralis CBS 781.70]KAF1813130.1 P-loop containing nucleoside triphosphate hydrolase protein [Eremomyces bilateralis CBS 781.70]